MQTNIGQPGELQKTGALDDSAAVTAGEVDAGQSVADLLRAACGSVPFRSAAIDKIESKMQALLDRLSAGQLQLAVVGQFKRGKSTLLNALLGAPILPSAVTPLTAIPTFLRAGDHFEVATEYSEGRKEQVRADNLDEVTTLLRDRVTEDGNPHNRAGIARVEVRADAPLLRTGIVHIDTPGIGSTYTHNTEVAKAALPECDMALFVVSPDPPITETELAYLKEIRDVSNGVVIVLNKIDLVEGEDRTRSERFLSDTVLEGAGITSAWFFSVSARKALAARIAGDKAGLAQSGLPALESYLVNFARTKRHEALEGAIAKRATDLVDEALFEIVSRLAALQMPVADLSDRMLRFAAAGETFERERQTIEDILSGDRSRLLSDLDEKAAALHKATSERLSGYALGRLAEGVPEVEIIAQFERDVPKLFQSEFEQFEAQTRAALTQLLHEHQKKGDGLIANVRELAITLLEIPYVAPVAEEAFQAKKIPYWVTVPRQSLVTAPHVIETLLPSTIRLERKRDRLRQHVEEIVTRNVENLRWALRQNMEASLRAFQAQLDDRLRLTQDATRIAMEAGLRRRQDAEDSARDELAQLTAAAQKLRLIKRSLEELQ